MFSRAEYEAVIREIENGTRTLEAKLAEVHPAAQKAKGQWWITPPAAMAIEWIADKTVEIGKAILNWFLDLLKGAVAPIFMFIDSYHWMDVRGSANGVSVDLTAQNLVVDNSDWSGAGHDAYLTTVGAQSSAAGRVGSIATGTSVNLFTCAAAGLAFYVTLAAVLAKLIAALVVVIAAFGSVVFSWAGLALFLEEAGVNTGIIVTAALTLGAFLAAQATAMIMLHGDAVDPSGFPGGVWPTSNTSQYSDASVLDGDADWSLRSE